MRGDELTVGQVIDWRGFPATVVEAWAHQDESEIDKAPVGAIIEWTENGQVNRCRIWWPDLTFEERSKLNDEAVEALLPTDLAEVQVTVWEG